MEDKMARLQEGQARIEGTVEQMNQRLNHLDSDIRDLRTEVHGEIGQLRTELHTETGRLGTELHTETGRLRGEIADLRRLMLQILIPMWVTIILAILALFTQL